MNKFKLTEREKDILDILWKANKPLAGSDFKVYDNTLATSTAIIYLRKLLNKELIMISDYEMRKTALTRTYVPTLSRQEYETEKYFYFLNKNEFDANKFMASFFDGSAERESELDELNKIEQFIKDRKAKLQKE